MKLFSTPWVQAAVNDETEINASDENLVRHSMLEFSWRKFEIFLEVDAARCTSKKSSDEKIIRSMLNGNEDKSAKANDEVEEILFTVPSISEVFFIAQVGLFFS